MNDSPLTVSASEAAKLLGVSLQAVTQRIKRGTLKATKEGNRYRIPVDHLDVNAVDLHPEGVEVKVEVNPVEDSRQPVDVDPEGVDPRSLDESNTVRELEAANAELRDSLAASEQEKGILSVKLESLQRELDATQREAESLRRAADAHRDEVQHLRGLSSEQSATIAQLTELSKANAVLLQQERAGRIARPIKRGLFARLLRAK